MDFPTGYVMPPEVPAAVNDIYDALKVEGEKASDFERSASIVAIGGKVMVRMRGRTFEISRGRDGKLASVEIVR